MLQSKSSFFAHSLLRQDTTSFAFGGCVLCDQLGPLQSLPFSLLQNGLRSVSPLCPSLQVITKFHFCFFVLFHSCFVTLIIVSKSVLFLFCFVDRNLVANHRLRAPEWQVKATLFPASSFTSQSPTKKKVLSFLYIFYFGEILSFPN